MTAPVGRRHQAIDGPGVAPRGRRARQAPLGVERGLIGGVGYWIGSETTRTIYELAVED